MISSLDLGLMPYREAWALQERLREDRLQGRIPDQILFVRHPPVITLGRRDCREDLLSPPQAIEADGIEIVQTNRGGRAAYHGPGQLVVYFICELAAFEGGVPAFVGTIEESCIDLLSGYGISSARDGQHPGVWVGRDKIAAIGLNIAHGVTEHGLALNVGGDLSPYRHIVACGIRGRGVTSLERLLRRSPAMAEITRDFRKVLEKTFSEAKGPGEGSPAGFTRS